jgi:lysyl-tRNA synthetase class 2
MAWSSVIRGAWYLPQRRQLDLLFTSGRRYIYSNVPLAVATGFAEAESKGRFYNAHIRNRFACREVIHDGAMERRAA